jgi:hypothetical protein
MTARDEEYLLESIEQIRHEVHRNYQMLCGVCDVVNMYLGRHHQENEDDFGRNVLANIVSSVFDGMVRKR